MFTFNLIFDLKSQCFTRPYKHIPTYCLTLHLNLYFSELDNMVKFSLGSKRVFKLLHIYETDKVCLLLFFVGLQGNNSIVNFYLLLQRLLFFLKFFESKIEASFFWHNLYLVFHMWHFIQLITSKSITESKNHK